MPTEPVVVVGRTCVGDFCHVPGTVEGVPCTALVDTGSTVTLVRPDVVPGWTQLEPTTVQLRTVTGGLAPMKGRGEMTLTVGGEAVRHPVWVASVQDPCILGLDFLKATGCQLDLGRGTLRFQDGPVIALSAVTPPVAAPTTLPAREVGTAEQRATPTFPRYLSLLSPCASVGGVTAEAAMGRGGKTLTGHQGAVVKVRLAASDRRGAAEGVERACYRGGALAAGGPQGPEDSCTAGHARSLGVRPLWCHQNAPPPPPRLLLGPLSAGRRGLLQTV